MTSALRALGLLCCPLVFSLSACAASPAKFNTVVVPEFETTPHTAISVLGVYRNGRMEVEAWDDISGILLGPLHVTECPAVFSRKLQQATPDVASAIDDSARDIGTTDELLDQIAPMAAGDTILVIHVSGKLPEKKKDESTSAPPMPAAGTPRPRGSRGRQAIPANQNRLLEQDALEVSATLFSPALHHSIAELTMKYSGASVDEALQQFAQELSKILPGARCGDWNWNAKLDADKIRKVASPQ